MPLILCSSFLPFTYFLPLLSSLPSSSVCGWLVESDGSKMRTRGPFCIFICPSVPLHSSGPIAAVTFSLRSPSRFLSILSVCQQPSSALNTSTIYPLLSLSVPCCTVSPSAPPLHPWWTKWTPCSKINFEMNEATVFCTCRMIFCQKCSEGYVLMYLLPRHSTVVTCSFLGSCSGVWKQICLVSKKHISI